jgi:hypothetical protein
MFFTLGRESAPAELPLPSWPCHPKRTPTALKFTQVPIGSELAASRGQVHGVGAGAAHGPATLLVTALALVVRASLLVYGAHFPELGVRRAATLTVAAGGVLGVLVSISSVGAGAIGVTALIILEQVRTRLTAGGRRIRTLSPTLISLRNRKFESISLQRRVQCEPGFVARTDLPLRRLIRINGLVCERDDLFNGLHIYDRGVLEKENQSNGPAGFAWRS